MDILHDLSLAALMLFVAFIVFDWGRIWWYARRHGIIKFEGSGQLDKSFHPFRWEKEYFGYKAWTWVVLIATWVIALWHTLIALCWLAELLLELL